MLRLVLLYLSQAGWAKNIVTHSGLARRVVRRFVAGETEGEAIGVVKELEAHGLEVTVDVLGESVHEEAEARRAADAYISLLDHIKKEGLRAWVSLKLTALGIDIDPVLCEENLRNILTKAREVGARVTIDMEDTPYTQRTIDLFNKLRDEGFDNVRTVIQSYLYRSKEDISELAESSAGIRLCKGAYREPPEHAYPKKEDVDQAYVELSKILLTSAKEGKGYPGIATHDENMISAVKDHVRAENISASAFEFQMLHGVRSNMQEQLRDEGYTMRVYVPYGTQWYPYFMRRLAERPANLWFFASNFFRR